MKNPIKNDVPQTYMIYNHFSHSSYWFNKKNITFFLTDQQYFWANEIMLSVQSFSP